jgi:hypothetical protein
MGPYPRLIENAAIASTRAQTITIPYDFVPLPIATPAHQLLPDFTTVPFVNSVGSTAVTVFSMLDALSFLAILVVLLLAIRVVWWLYGFVTGFPTVETLDISGGLDTSAQVFGDDRLEDYGQVAKKAARFKKNPYRY